jgi:hypothetical protein
MQNFIAFENENMGGVNSFRFVPINDIASIPDAVNGKITSAVVLKSGKQWYTGLSVINKLKFNEEASHVTAGVLYRTRVSGSIPKLTDDYLALFTEMASQRFLLEITDNNGYKRLCGKYLMGLRFDFNQDSGGRPSDTNGWEYSFTIDHRLPSYFYEV